MRYIIFLLATADLYKPKVLFVLFGEVPVLCQGKEGPGCLPQLG